MLQFKASLLLLFVLPLNLYVLSDEKSSIQFTIKNLGVGVDGTFTGLKGEVMFNPDRDDNWVELTIRTKTINTGIGLRDSHLRKEKYFDVANHPVIRFVSTSLVKNSTGWTARGQMTIKNITKDITFPFSVVRRGSDTYELNGEFSINRRHFNVGENSFSLSDELIVRFSVEATKQP